MTDMICFDCMGDGKETCHNPDHGFISAMSWHDIGRLGCPVCGHHPRHKVGSRKPGGGAPCDTCHGAGVVNMDVNRDFCNSVGYNFEEILGYISSYVITTNIANNPNQLMCNVIKNTEVFWHVHSGDK